MKLTDTCAEGAADKGNFVILILTHDKAKGKGPNKPVSFSHVH